jgi:excisionase family DNA binding protein
MSLDNDEPFLCSIRRTQRELDCSRSEVYRKIKRGQIEAVRDGGRRKIVVASLRKHVTHLREAAAHRAEQPSP